MTRRVERKDTGRYRYVVWVTPGKPDPEVWGTGFEERALRNGYICVIDGQVIEPGTPEARAAISRLDARVTQ